MKPPGSWTTIYGIAAIGVLILLVACFNFTNLATARATMRAREVSLRKVVGGDAAPAGHPVPGRVGADGAAGAGPGAGAGGSAAARLRPVSWAGRSASTMSRTGRCSLVIGRASPWSPACSAASIRPWCCPAFAPPPSCAPTGPAGRLGLLAHRAGGAAVCGLHRPGHRRPGDLRPDILCPQHGSGLPQGQYRGHRRRQHVAADAGHASSAPCATSPAFWRSTASSYVPFDGNNSNMRCACPGQHAQSRPMRIVPVDPDFPRALWRKAAGRAAAGQNRGSDATSAPFTPRSTADSAFNVLINEAGGEGIRLHAADAMGKHVFLHNTDVIVPACWRTSNGRDQRAGHADGVSTTIPCPICGHFGPAARPAMLPTRWPRSTASGTASPPRSSIRITC